MKNALHLLVFNDDRHLTVMRNTRPDSPMYQDSLAAHRRQIELIRNLLTTCQVDAEDRAAFGPRYLDDISSLDQIEAHTAHRKQFFKTEIG
jgi:hypothetical protein